MPAAHHGMCEMTLGHGRGTSWYMLISLNRRDEKFHSHFSVNSYGVLLLLEAHIGDLRLTRDEFESLASKQHCAEREYRSRGSK
jgi:hypothetical protein